MRTSSRRATPPRSPRGFFFEEPDRERKVQGARTSHDRPCSPVFALWQPESFGVFANRNRWRIELERFRYEMKDDEVQAVWPLSGKRATLTIKAERCRVDDWDFCLQIEGAPTGVKRYYSRVGWERKDRRSVDEAIAELLDR